MRWRRPHGTLIQATPDWFINNMMGGELRVGGSAGVNSFVGVHNNATDGSILHLWGIHCWAIDPAAGAVCRFTTPPIGTIATGTPSPLNPNEPIGWGTIRFGNNSGQPGLKFYAFSGNNTPTDWYSTWPFAILPPNWMMLIETANNQIDLVCAFMWCVMGPNEGLY